MNLLVCAPAYPPSVGGVQTLSARLAGGLAERGHSVEVLARGGERDPRIDRETAPARISRVGWKPMLWPAFAMRVFLKRPDAVLLTHRADFLRLALSLRRIRRYPAAVVVHGNEIYGSDRMGELIGALSCFDAVIGVSRYTRERLIGLGLPAEKVHAIANGVSFEGFDPPEAGGAVRARLGLGGKKVLLSVGRLHRVKGFDTVIRALPRIIEKEPGVVYVIVGAGPEESAWRALASGLGLSERVIFAGEAPLGEIGRGDHSYYQACDLFVMPGREDPESRAVEAYGIAYLEAGACGKPVIGGRAGGAPEAVADGVSGLLADGERPEEVADAILRLLAEPEKMRAMGEAGRLRAEQRRWAQVAAEYEEVLQSLAVK